MANPTRRQLQVLRLIAKRVNEGMSPTAREILADLNLGPNNINAVFGHMTLLKRQGLVSWEEGKARTLRLTTAGKVALENGGRVGEFIPVTQCSLCGASRAGEGSCPMCAPNALMRPDHGFLIECLCGYSTGRCESWEDAGRDFDEHLAETKGRET